MGVEAEVYLLPRDNTFRPSAAQLAALVAMWIEERYVPRPPGYDLPPGQSHAHTMDAANPPVVGHSTLHASAQSTGAYVQQGGPDDARPLPLDRSLEALTALVAAPSCRIVWPMPQPGAMNARSPMQDLPAEFEDDWYYELRIDISDDFIYRISETVEPFPTTACGCGAELSYSPAPDIFYAGRIRCRCPQCGTPFRPQDQQATIVDGLTGDVSMLSGGATSRFAITIDIGKNVHDDMAADDIFKRRCEAALGTPLYQVVDIY